MFHRTFKLFDLFIKIIQLYYDEDIAMFDITRHDIVT